MLYKISEMIKKIKSGINPKRSKYPYVCCPGSYGPALDFVENFLCHGHTAEEEKLFLNYVIELIGRDIETSVETLHVYKPEHEACCTDKPFPTFCADKPCVSIPLVNKENKIAIELEKNIVITEPWDLYLRLLRNLKNIKENKFQYDRDNHDVVYYPYMNICRVESGNHSISCGKHFKNGTVEACVYDTETAFKYIDTDGKNWIFYKGYMQPQEVVDFRYAILFQIAKLLYNSEKENSAIES